MTGQSPLLCIPLLGLYYLKPRESAISISFLCESSLDLDLGWGVDKTFQKFNKLPTHLPLPNKIHSHNAEISDPIWNLGQMVREIWEELLPGLYHPD